MDATFNSMISFFMLWPNKEYDILGVTCTSGIESIDIVSQKILDFMEFIQAFYIPVYKGWERNYLGEETYADCKECILYTCELGIPAAISKKIEMLNASHAIEYFSLSSPNEITLLCFSPLTNVAIAWKNNESIFDKLKDIYVVGGDRTTGCYHERSIPCEINSYFDPLAFQITLTNFKPSSGNLIFLFDEYFYRKNQIPIEFYNEIIRNGEDNKKNRKIFVLKKAIEKGGCKYLSDREFMYFSNQYAVCCYLDPQILLSSTPKELKYVFLSGLNKGKTELQNGYDPNLLLVDEVDVSKVKELITKSFFT